MCTYHFHHTCCPHVACEEPLYSSLQSLLLGSLLVSVDLFQVELKLDRITNTLQEDLAYLISLFILSVIQVYSWGKLC